ncbi:MAG: DegV family protein [Evtepia sp.]
MKTAIVTDTNSGITAQMAREMGIYLIPMPFFIDGSTYYEGETCTPDFFFRHLKAKAEVSTSQPSPEVITSLWASLLETHDAVLHFPMTAGLSGSCETAKALAQEFDGRVLVVDDHRISVTLAQSIRNAQTLLAQGKTAQEVRGILEAEKMPQHLHCGEHLGIPQKKRPRDSSRSGHGRRAAHQACAADPGRQIGRL